MMMVIPCVYETRRCSCFQRYMLHPERLYGPPWLAQIQALKVNSNIGSMLYRSSTQFFVLSLLQVFNPRRRSCRCHGLHSSYPRTVFHPPVMQLRRFYFYEGIPPRTGLLRTVKEGSTRSVPAGQRDELVAVACHSFLAADLQSTEDGTLLEWMQVPVAAKEAFVGMVCIERHEWRVGFMSWL